MKDKKWGYIDHEGKWIINPQFEVANYFSEDLALVKGADGKYGYIGKDGRYVINPQYVDGTHFSEGVAFVVSENGFPTCIDKNGKAKFVLKDAEEVAGFICGRARVKVNGNYGFVNSDGKNSINPQFKFVGSFVNDHAVFGIKDPKDTASLIYGFIDLHGKIIVNPQFKSLGTLIDGLAYASSDGKKFGFVDEKGTYTINPQFDDAESFSEGLAPVKQGENWGYINKSGKLVINPQFEKAGLFSEGLSPVRSGKENWGYVDNTGKLIINPQFAAADCFHGGIALVVSGKQFGIIDKEGKYKVNPQFDDAYAYFLSSFWPQNIRTAITFVNSDYFDGEAIARKIIGNVGKGNGLRGLTNALTYTTLRPSLGPDISESAYSSDATDYKEKEVTDGVSISQTTYSFVNKLQQYNSGYFNANYTYVAGGYSITPDNKLNQVTIKIKLKDWGRTKNKAERMADAIKKVLIQIAKVSETGTDQNSNERTRATVAQILSEANAKEHKKASFLFGAHCQYLIVSDNESNSVELSALLIDGATATPKENASSTHSETTTTDTAVLAAD